MDDINRGPCGYHRRSGFQLPWCLYKELLEFVVSESTATRAQITQPTSTLLTQGLRCMSYGNAARSLEGSTA